MTSRQIILRTLATAKPELAQRGVSAVGLFGSYAQDAQNPDSDIDLLIDFKAGAETFENFMDVCDLLQNLFSGHRIEVVTKNGLSPHIGPYILKSAVYA